MKVWPSPLPKSGLHNKCFVVNCKILQNSFFTEHTLATGSGRVIFKNFFDKILSFFSIDIKDWHKRKDESNTLLHASFNYYNIIAHGHLAQLEIFFGAKRKFEIFCRIISHLQHI